MDDIRDQIVLWLFFFFLPARFPLLYLQDIFLLCWQVISFLFSLFSACRKELSTELPLSLLALDEDYTEGCKQASRQEGEREREVERDA